MRTLMFVRKGELEWHEAPALRVTGPLEAVVRPIAATACDLDRRILMGATPFQPPFALGHECVAEVLDVGDRVEHIVPGDVVVVPWHINCGTCASCRSGMTAHCDTVPGPINCYGVPIGADYGGLFSEEVRVPFADGMLVKVPAGLDPAWVASASDNLTDAYIGVARALAKHPGVPVLVIGGLESLPLMAITHALAAGAASVDYVDENEERRQAASRLGATTHAVLPPSFDRAFRVVIGGSREGAMLTSAIRCLAPGGHLSNVAMFFADTSFPMWEAYQRDISVSLGMPSVRPHIPKVLSLAACGHIHPERIITPCAWDEAPTELVKPHLKPVMVRSRVMTAAAPPLAPPLPARP